MPTTEADLTATLATLQMLYRGSVAAVLVYDWATKRCPNHSAELMAVRDLHHSCQILLAQRIRSLGGTPEPEVLTWASAILARIDEADLEGIRSGLLGCERSGWRACNESFEHVTCEVRCFLEDEIRSRLEESLVRTTDLVTRLACSDR
jgi:hypothetical protein